MVARHLQLGTLAETAAAGYLEARGLRVLGRNLRCRAGEIDLVCLDRDVLVLVEVRCRSAGRFGGASASVSASKQRKLLRAARFHWQRRRDWHCRPMRFDVIALDGPAARITWIKDAFRGL